MTQREQAELLRRIQEAILNGRYVVTPHALLEMRNDALDLIDVESAILTGRIETVFDDDPRGRRFEVVGKACDLTTEVSVLVRFAGPVLIITVYVKSP